jgi:acyl-CoA thioesterase
MQPIEKCLQNDKFVAHCGVELVEVRPGNARAKLKLQQHHLNGLGIVQGGAIFTLADFAFAAASNAHGTVAVAANANITFMKAVSTGTLWADAREVSKNFKLGSYTVEVKDEQGEIVAVFQGLAYRKNEKLPSWPSSPRGG